MPSRKRTKGKARKATATRSNGSSSASSPPPPSSSSSSSPVSNETTESSVEVVESYTSFSQFPRQRQRVIHTTLTGCKRALKKANRALTNVTGEFNNAYSGFFHGYQTLLPQEHKVCAINFAYGCAKTLLDWSKKTEQPIDPTTRDALMQLLASTINPEVETLTDQLACKAFVTLCREQMELDLYCTDIDELTSFVLSLQELLHFGDLFLMNADGLDSTLEPLPNKWIEEVSAQMDEAKATYLSVLDNFEEEDLSDVDEEVRLFTHTDAVSVQREEWFTDIAVDYGLKHVIPIDDGKTRQVVLSICDTRRILHSDDVDCDTLAHTLGLSSDSDQVRVFIPISDAMEDANVVGDAGSHYSKYVLEGKIDRDSNEIVLRGMHINSLKSTNQMSIINMFRDKVCSLLSDRFKVTYRRNVELERVPQQSDGFSCGPRVIVTAEMFSQLPFGVSPDEVATRLKETITIVSVERARHSLEESLRVQGVDKVLHNATLREHLKFAKMVRDEDDEREESADQEAIDSFDGKIEVETPTGDRIVVEDVDDEEEYAPRSFKRQPYSVEVKEKLRLERENDDGMPSDLDARIKQFKRKLRLPTQHRIDKDIELCFKRATASDDDNAFVDMLVMKHALYEEDYTDKTEYETRSNELHQLSSQVKTAILGPDFVGDVHLGTAIDHNDVFLTAQRYATRADKGSGTTASIGDCWNDKNGCNIAQQHLTPKWLAAEYAKRQGTHVSGVSDYEPCKSGGIDLVGVTLTKAKNGKLEEELDDIAVKHLGYDSVDQYKTTSLVWASIHIFNHKKHHNKPMRVNVGSSYTAKHWLGRRFTTIKNEYVEWYDTCHGQVWLTGCQICWSKKKRDCLAEVVVDFWTPTLGLPDDYDTDIVNEFGRNGRSDAVIEQMRKLRVTFRHSAVNNKYKKNKDACLEWCKTTEDKITYKQKESYFGHCGKKAGVESHYQKNKTACLEHCKTTEDKITYKQKESYQGYCAAKTHGGNKKKDGSKIDRTAASARAKNGIMKNADNKAKSRETKRMTALKKYADDPKKKAKLIMTRNRCLGCGQVNPPTIVGLRSFCSTDDCKHCTIPKNKKDLTKGYQGATIPNPKFNKVTQYDGVDRWKHVSTLSNDEKNKEIAKARAHKDVLRDRRNQGERKRRSDARQEESNTKKSR